MNIIDRIHDVRILAEEEGGGRRREEEEEEEERKRFLRFRGCLDS